jgi:GNAT superfamily N-acetyltransferase
MTGSSTAGFKESTPVNSPQYKIISVKGSSPEEKAFIRFPKELYRGQEHYVPFFDADMRILIRKKHPFFLHSEGEFLLLRRDGETVARALVCENRRYNDFHKTRFAFFDFFDSIDDQEAADTLFARLAEWTRARGLDALTGPMLSGGASGAGILIEGFDHPSAMTMMRYNFPYYRSLLEGAGFTKYVDLNSFSIPPDHFQLSERISRLAENVLKRGRFSVIRFRNKREIRALVEDIKTLYAGTLNHHLEDYPLSPEELEQVKKDLLTVADPELLSLLAYDGKVIGYAFGFADISTTLVRNRGRLGPAEILRLIRAFKKSGRILFNGIGILPEYQRLGGNALLYRELERMVKDRGFGEVEMVQISEKTELMISDAGSLGAKPFKIHRMYKKELHD